MSKKPTYEELEKRIKKLEKKTRLTESRPQEIHLPEMETISTLAGGIAHEINNALVGVTGNIHLLQMDMPDNQKLKKCSKAIEISVRRMAGLTDQLLAYAQGGKYIPKTISVNDLIKNSLPVLTKLLGSGIRLDTVLPDDVLWVMADITLMQVVFSNLVNNSKEAVKAEGFIKIKVSQERISKKFISQHPDFIEGTYICFSIEDNGEGMDPETLNRVFEPFFSTKSQGRGMGMAAVYGIVRNHAGHILIDSELGRSTRVSIYLPGVDILDQGNKKPVIKPGTEGKTILLIEDEEMIADVTGEILERLGYSILVARTGRDAIHIADDFNIDIDLALLDINLPDIEGNRLYTHIQKSRPGLKVIICSGYSLEGPAREIMDAGAQGFIQKPFSLEALSEILKEVLYK